MLPELRAFRADEEKHRAIFHQELQRRGLKRCKSYWLCAAGGYALCAATGLLGARAISLTTVAVERTVLRHLRRQTTLLAHDVTVRLPPLPRYWPKNRSITTRLRITVRQAACGAQCSARSCPA